MKNLLVRFVREEEGQDLVEYVFLVGFIALAVIAGVTLLGGNLNTKFDDVAGSVTAAPGAGS